MPIVRTSDERFRAAVARLYVPVMGTEAVGPLLAALLKLVRPQRVLEVGMGYTTPFLAAALGEIAEEVRTESPALAAKTNPYLETGAPLGEEWLNVKPSLLAPEFYCTEYRPRLVAVDDLSIPESSSARVQDVLRKLKLDHHVMVVNANLRDCIKYFPEDFHPIDLAWVDAWECLYFFDNFFELINPDGGLIVMHYLMTYPEGEGFLQYIAALRNSKPGQFEVINLLEPHKLTQNSITIIRRTSGVVARRYAEPGGTLNYDEPLRAQAEMQAAAAATASVSGTVGSSE
jgi:predicted O-methyltransferase YrrM